MWGGAPRGASPNTLGGIMRTNVEMNRQSQEEAQRDHQRNAWIVTGYSIFGLVLLVVIAYTVAQYAAR
jgi:hypothetical protein